jgi:hypothetical protein
MARSGVLASTGRGAVMTVIDTTHTGRRFGRLTVAYIKSAGRDIACRCCCGRLVHVAIADLVAGTVTSCGCQPASSQYHEQQRTLRQQMRREILFTITRSRS